MTANESSYIEDSWYKRSFDSQYPLVYAHRTIEAAAREAAFAAVQLNLRRGEQLLDLCCGNGRHMVHLLRYACAVTGLDWSEALLSEARGILGSEAALVRGDMRDLPFENAFDAVTNFFTSFGYFMDDAENARVVEQAARAMKPGGRFFIDHVNAAFIRKTLVPESTREYNEYRIEERRWLDAARRRVNKVTKVWRNGEPAGEWGESVRLYEPEEFRAVLANANLFVDRVFGDYDGALMDVRRPRMIVTGHKE